MARSFEGDDLRGARFRDVDLRGAQFRGAWMAGVEVDGIVDGMTINGVEVGPLVAAELDRRHPERTLLAFTDRAGAAAAWRAIDDLWTATIERAGRLPEPLLHERVDDEWSFLETLRHLVFVVDAYVGRTVLGEADPYWPAGVAHPVYLDDVTLDLGADPDLDEVVTAWTERWAMLGRVIDEADDADLERDLPLNPTPGYPPWTAMPLVFALAAPLREASDHHRYAVRDLAVLEPRQP